MSLVLDSFLYINKYHVCGIDLFVLDLNKDGDLYGV
jgi:hypothetical protein